MNEIVEAINAADRNSLLEIAADVFEKDYSKSKKKDETIRKELLALATSQNSEESKAPESEPETSDAADSQEEADDTQEDETSDDSEELEEEEQEKPRLLRNKNTGAEFIWTEALAKLDHMVEVE